MHPDEQIVTGEAVAVELRLAGVGSRGIAALIDFGIVTAAQLLLILLLVAGIGVSGSGDALVAGLVLGVVGITLGYPVAMETLWHGRTLGKAVMGLRVVRDDGGPIRFRHAFVRGLIGVAVDKPGLSYSLLAFIPIMVSTRKKRAGDFFAGTIVLQERVPGNINTTVAMPPQLARWAATLELSAIDDGLALRLRHYLGRAGQLTPAARAALEGQLTSEIVAKVGPPPADAPSWAVISAIVAERRRRAVVSQPADPLPRPAWWKAPPNPPASASAKPPAPVNVAPENQQPATTGTPPSAGPPASTTGFAPPG